MGTLTLKDLYRFFIEYGIENDPRGKSFVHQLLEEKKAKYEKSSAEQKEDFDLETLHSPYADSRILYETGNENIKSILVGIDIETPELLLAHTLKSTGKKIDLVITHHPEGYAYATFYKVIELQSDVLYKLGVPINIAESLIESRMNEVGRKVRSQNHNRAVDTAKILGIPFMSAHTVADNQVNGFLNQLITDKKPVYLSDVIKILRSLPEYKESDKIGAGPTILLGDSDKRTGKIFVDMTGGTEGPKEAIKELADKGVGTIVGMHMSEDHYNSAKKHHVNVIIAGHIASDNLGINLLLDATERKFGKIEVIECSGFRRFRR